MVKHYNLRFGRILWIAPYKYVSWMRVAMDETCYEDLLCKRSHHILHNFILIEPVLLYLCFVSDFNAVYPLRNEHTLLSKFVVDLWNTDIVSL